VSRIFKWQFQSLEGLRRGLSKSGAKKVFCGMAVLHVDATVDWRPEIVQGIRDVMASYSGRY
jgi:hypothetical protein